MTSPQLGVSTCWVFDLDGTVVDSEARFHAAYTRAVEQAGHAPVTVGEFRRRSRGGTLVEALGLSPPEAAALWHAVMAGFVTSEHSSCAIPGARATLSRLRAGGARIALVTGRVCAVGLLQAELRQLGLKEVFDVIATSASLRLAEGARQSKDDLFRVVLTQLGAPAAASVYVTDWPPDLADAHAFGFGQCIGVKTGGFGDGDFPGGPGVRVVESIATLVA